jgi:hypothetical protein
VHNGCHGGPYRLYTVLLQSLGGRELPEDELVFQVMEKTRMLAELRMYRQGLPIAAIAAFLDISEQQVVTDLKRMREPRRKRGGVSAYRMWERRVGMADSR